MMALLKLLRRAPLIAALVALCLLRGSPLGPTPALAAPGLDTSQQTTYFIPQLLYQPYSRKFPISQASNYVGSSKGGGMAGGFLLENVVRDTAIHVTWTTSIAQPPYPTRLAVYLVDSSSVAGVNCGTVAITGIIAGPPGSSSPNIIANTETLSTVNATTQYTTYAYESVSKIAANNCHNAGAGTNAANNNTWLAVAMSAQVWLPRKLVDYRQIGAICRYPVVNLYGKQTGTTGTWVKTATIAHTGYQVNSPWCLSTSALALISSTVLSAKANTIDLSAAYPSIGQTVANGDAFYIRLRQASY